MDYLTSVTLGDSKKRSCRRRRLPASRMIGARPTQPNVKMIAVAITLVRTSALNEDTASYFQAPQADRQRRPPAWTGRGGIAASGGQDLRSWTRALREGTQLGSLVVWGASALWASPIQLRGTPRPSAIRTSTSYHMTRRRPRIQRLSWLSSCSPVVRRWRRPDSPARRYAVGRAGWLGRGRLGWPVACLRSSVGYAGSVAPGRFR